MSEKNKLKEIYVGIERSLLAKSTNKVDAKGLLAELNKTIILENDQDYYRALVTAIFHGSGIKAVQLEPVLDDMFNNRVFQDYKDVLKLTSKQKNALCDPSAIGYKQSLNRVFSSTELFGNKIKQHGSLLDYVDAHNQDTLFKDLKTNFPGLGEKSTYHFLKECGHPYIKPDSVIGRIFSRLDLIDDQDDIKGISRCADKIVEITGHKHQRIDLVLVKFGAEGKSNLFHIEDGICREKNPDCGNCFVKHHCSFKYHSRLR